MSLEGLMTSMGLTETQPLVGCIVLLSVALVLNVVRTLVNKPMLYTMAWWAALGSVIGLVVSLWFRSETADYFALSNMYESLLVVCGWMLIGHLFLEKQFHLRYLGWPTCLLILGTIFYATTLPTDILPLQAALQSYWRSIHVPIILLSYAMFTLSLVCSLAYLVTDSGGFGLFQGRGGQGKGSIVANGPQQEVLKSQEMGGGLTLLDAYDEVTYRCIALGFPLLAIGIILGGLWANEAWGNYWSWDPKESMSLVTLLVYGVYLHLRVNGEHHPRVLSWVSVAGFAILLLTYFGVNIMGVGLHSYGKIG